MPKFSIIIPVYNTCNYLKRCFDSIENQTFSDYEVIIVNDGSTDDSRNVISSYLDNDKFICIDKENGGLSDARNAGIKEASGEYLIFLDSDDYISYQMLEILNSNLDDDIDVLKFQCKYIYDDKQVCVNDNIDIVGSGEEVLTNLIKIHSLLEPAWLYVYKTSFWKNNNFMYEKGIYHEDFALTPYVLSKAKKIKVINDNLYYYVQVQNSITRNSSYEKTYKKVYDMYKGFTINYKNINDNPELNVDFKKLFNSYLANIIIKKGLDLNKNDRKEYYSNLKKNKIYDMLLTDSFSRKMKKLLLKMSPSLYFKLVGDK